MQIPQHIRQQACEGLLFLCSKKRLTKATFLPLRLASLPQVFVTSRLKRSER